MKTITHEKLVANISEIVARTIGERPDDMDFANGGGYIQHSADSVDLISKSIRELGGFPMDTSMGFMGRCLSDSSSPNSAVLCCVWTRLYSIDGQNREWGHPYYAFNSGTGKDNRIR